MKQYTFQFSRPDFASEKPWDRVISEGICKDTKSEICHVDYMRFKPDGSYTLMGAHIGGGFQEREPDCEKWGLRIRVTNTAEDRLVDLMEAKAQSFVGTGYDVKDILGIAIANANLHDAHKLICSGAAAELLDNDQYHIVRIAKDHWQVSPEELRIALTALPGAVELRIEG